MSIYLGEIAAIFTAMCWSMTSVFFTLAGRRVGSVIVNRVRIVLAVIFLSLTHWVMFSTPFPVAVEAYRWFWLAISGVIGLAVADAMLFQAYVLIGPRLGILMMSLAPVVSALLAWIFLGETLRPGQIAGIVLAVGGIMWVILGRDGRPVLASTDNRDYVLGVLFGMGAATGQAIGLVTAKKGLGGDFSALSGNLIRMVVAAVVLWAATLALGRAGYTVKRFFGERQAALNIVAGSFFGPFLGVSAALVAIQLTQIGIASTLMALPPIFLLPVARFYFKERVGWPAVAGTLLAVGGVTVLLLS
jgi:drug/metabolite transporter (DMT)-like permease